MTGAIIPADQWPEWADRHCWDERGIGQFIGIQTDKYSWRKWAANSGIPMPDGWDWHVPVMRHQTAPAIDLEQFRRLAELGLTFGRGSIRRSASERLQALIDGQAKSGDDTQRLEWLMRNISGAELRRLNVWTDASCDRAAIDKAMQPTKGEGE